MPTIIFGNGTKVSVSRTPTHDEVTQIAQQLGIVGAGTESAPDQSSGYPSASEAVNRMQSIAPEAAAAPGAGTKTGYEMPEAPMSMGQAMAEVPGGLARGLASSVNLVGEPIVNATELAQRAIGATKGGVPDQTLRGLLEAYNRNVQGVVGGPSKGLPGKIAESVGAVPGMVGLYSSPLAEEVGAVKLAGIMGLLNRQSQVKSSGEGLGKAVLGAGGDALTMALLEKAQATGVTPRETPVLGKPNYNVNLVPGALLGGGVSAASSAFNGGTGDDIIAAATTGALFSSATPEKLGAMQDVYRAAKRFSQDPAKQFEFYKKNTAQDRYTAAKDQSTANLKDLQYQAQEAPRKVAEELAAQKEKLDEAKDTKLGLISEQEKAAKAEFKAKQDAIDHDKIVALKKLEADRANYEMAVPETAFDVAKLVHQKLPEMQQRMNDVYGPILDEQIGRVETNPTEASGLIREIESAIRTDLGDTHPALKDLFNLSGRYDRSHEAFIERAAKAGLITKRAASELLGHFESDPKAGLSMFDSLVRGDKRLSAAWERFGRVKFGQEVYKPLRALMQSYGPRDHATSLMRAAVGDYVAKKTGDKAFQELQNEYRENVRLFGSANRKFVPHKSEADLNSGVALLEKFAGSRVSKEGLPTPGPSGPDQALVKFLVNPIEGKFIKTDMFGDIMKPLQELSDRITEVDNHIARLNDELVSPYVHQAAELTKAHLAEIAALDKAKKLTNSAYEESLAKLKDDLNDVKRQSLDDIARRVAIRQRGEKRINEALLRQKQLSAKIDAFGNVASLFGFWKAHWAARAIRSTGRVGTLKEPVSRVPSVLERTLREARARREAQRPGSQGAPF